MKGNKINTIVISNYTFNEYTNMIMICLIMPGIIGIIELDNLLSLVNDYMNIK